MNDIMGPQGDPTQEVVQLRSQGLTDAIILDELSRKGYTPDQVHTAISQLDGGQVGPAGSVGGAPAQLAGGMPMPPGGQPMGGMPMPPGGAMGSPSPPIGGTDDGYGRIEEIVEGLIDEKWDELIGEVKKIVEWKEKIESQQTKIVGDLDKLKEDFKVLHQGVLGQLEEYDRGMKHVGTELKAVGKVFKDVIPQFVENVKQLSHVTKSVSNTRK